MDRRCLEFILLLVFALFFCCYPVKAQTYQVQESQLKKLEMEFQNLKKENLNQKEFIQNLKKVSTDRQKTILQLNQSCNRLENKLLESEIEKNELKEELSKEQLNGQKKTITIFFLSAVIVVLCFIIGLMLFLRIKKIF